MKLTPKQELFCQEYLIDLNAAAAAVRSGYSERTAKDIACQNLAKLNISQRIAELKKKRNERVQVTADEVLAELKKIAFGSATDIHKNWDQLKDWDSLTGEEKSIISEIKIIKTSAGVTRHIKIFDRLKALDLLARHVGLFEKDNAQQQIPIINYVHVPSNPARKDD